MWRSAENQGALASQPPPSARKMCTRSPASLVFDAASAASALASVRSTSSTSRPDTTPPRASLVRSEEHTSELQSLMRISYAVFCLKKKNTHPHNHLHYTQQQP